ncbi:MAG: FAD-binding protein [Candidatus Dadabacteria bacterium]|nr:FAD-binding protein [Candidatus Dadabacteria bacterium]MYC39395.1 FAD-binding protein [Candidatus Dadabacteria bacterium]
MEKSRIEELSRKLRGQIRGEVRENLVDRTIYSTDASNYRILPEAVVIPKNRQDIEITVSEASARDIPVTVRGAGTSLAGQAVGEGVILDLSKYMNGIIDVDAGGKKARVEPGITIDGLNRNLAPLGLMFGPDPSSASVATVGGAVANNATGAHSILYGMAGDHVISSNAVLADGSPLELSKENYEKRGGGNGIAENLFEKLAALIKENGELVRNDFSRHWRRASGYSLNYFLDREFNPAKLLASSEGTLAVSTDFELNLVEKPRSSALCVISFREIPEAMDSVSKILSRNPSAIELIDGTLIGLARRKKGFSRAVSFIEGTPGAILVVEFQGDDERQTGEKAKSLAESAVPGATAFPVLGREEQKKVWDVRKAGLGILMSDRGKQKPVPCIEDVSVPTENLAQYTRDVISLLDEFGLKAAFYGHASAGCLHIRPLLDLREQKGVSDMVALSERTLELVLRHSGVMSGEHGDGLQRSYLNEKLFGKKLYSIMEELKEIFDPRGILNPGKVVRGADSSSNLRARKSEESLNTFLDWSREGGLAAAAAMCNGQGVCRKTAEGIMCPSYRATLDEGDTTRARANLLRELLLGDMDKEMVYEKGFYDVFDLCVGCKACRTECPSGVDVGKMKTEFLALYKNKTGFTARDMLFARVHEISSARSALPRFLNRALESPFSRGLLSLAGISRRRSLPPMAEDTFSGWFRKKKKNPQNGKQVVYFHDTWSEFFYPEIGKAVIGVLESLGFEVLLERQRKCCGRPMLSTGMVEKARENAAHNVNVLSDYARRNIPVVFSEPSCLSAFRDEYADLLPGNESLDTLLPNTHSVCEFVRAQGDNSLDPGKQRRGGILVHGHCHERSVGNFGKTLSLLNELGYDARTSDAGCCGMAGSFGYEKEHYEVSKAMGECGLFPKIRDLGESERVCVTGISCLEQVSHFTGVVPVHIALLLEECISAKDAK